MPTLPFVQDSKPLLGESKPLFSPMMQTVSHDQPLQQQPAMQSPVQISGSTREKGASTLSEKDLKAFKSDKFTLGKIPEHPPPPDLC